MYNLTSEQQEIVNFDGNLIVNAGPGSGKTYTIVQYVKEYIKKFPNKQTLIVVFNDSIATEINTKINHPNVYCYTLHTLGSAVLKHAQTGFKFNKYLQENRNSKYKTILKKLIGYFPGSNIVLQNCLDLINLGRMVNINFDSAFDLHQLAFKHDIQILGEELSHVSTAIKIGLQQFIDCKWYDFADMIYLPFKLNLKLENGNKIGYGQKEKYYTNSFDLIVADECQDFGFTMQNVIKQFAHDNTQFAFFGDSKQSINGFTGSDPQSFSTLKTIYDCSELKLNTIFRCPISHVENLNKNYGTNYTSAKLENGVIDSLTYVTMLENLQNGDVVLGRFKEGKEAKLWNLFFDLLAQGKDCSLFGLDAYQLYDKVVPDELKNNYQTLFKNLSAHSREIIQNYNDKNWKTIAETYQSETNIVLQLIHHSPSNSIESFEKWLNVLSYDRKNTVNLSTIHRAKGKEWQTVYIIDENKMPLQPKQEWQQQQENNVKYVAQSRSLENMFYVNS